MRCATPFRVLVLAALLVADCLLCCPQARADVEPPVVHFGRNVQASLSSAQIVGRVEPSRQIRLTFVLPLRDPKGRADLLQRLYDPSDPLYRHFLTAGQFADRFAPTADSVSEVANYAQSQGMSVDEIAGNRMVVRAHGPASAVEHAFQMHLNDYAAQDGSRFRSPDREPTMPAQIAGRLLTVDGFDDLPAATTNSRRAVPTIDSLTALPDTLNPRFVRGTGPNGYLAPSDVQSIYSLTTVPSTGTGQVLGLFELDGYTSSDIAAYEHEFYPSHPSAPLQNVLVDGFDGKAQTIGGASEVTLDIDMMIALAPSASRIVVYEADNTTSGLIAAYNRIASDNVATVVSSSWGIYETAANYYGQINPESQIFEEMAAQGQTLLAASGDSGAYGDSWTLMVQDPASQPFVTGVGGTDLSVGNGSPSVTYQSESAWGDPSDTYGLRPRGQGGGGGISLFQTLPDYQGGIATAGSSVSKSVRNVPDVSLYGDYDTGGYAIYFTDPANPTGGGTWEGYNGTSAASPLWAGFIALVDQGRAQSGRAPIGFLNPAIYAIGKNPAAYARDFHDVQDGSTNLHYPAVHGYDLATGWGSFIGSSLYQYLVSSLTPPTVANFSPTSGAAGVTVSIAGTGFTGTTSVTLGGVPAKFVIDSDSRLTIIIPGGAKTAPIAIANAFGTGDSKTSFVITSERLLAITSITPPNAQAGMAVTVLGSGFTGATLVTVGGVPVAFSVAGDGKIVFTVPAGERGGIVAVTTPLGTVESVTRTGALTWSPLSVTAVADGTARILWVRNDSAAGLWSMDASNRMSAEGPIYGPFTSGNSVWNAISLVAAPDGSSRVLWSRDDGAAGVWTMNAAGVATMIGPTYGPFNDPTGHWAAVGIAVASDGSSRILWDRSDGAIGIWTLNSSDAETRIGSTYMPYAENQSDLEAAIGIACAPDGTTRVLWNSQSGGMAVVVFNSSDQLSLTGSFYGPYSDDGGDWYPLSLTVTADGFSRVLWGRNDGAAGVWSVNASGAEISTGIVYGPYAQFSPFNLSASGDQFRLLWVNNDRAGGLWTFDSANRESLIGPTYGPY